jgi:hypothetical protein
VYVTKVEASAEDTCQMGYILQQEETTIVATATTANVPPP